ncbi:JmjC domain-containing protein [Kitasatospora sp. NPDC101155]|uniref:JmjC domain-containing protein n=1 Tax=Kitasatospora sp. NPDC101155 TaxID=3364097 RepID=UPI003807C052
MPLPEFDLARLLAPVTVEEFERDFREQQPLHVAREQPGHYRELLTLDDFDRLLALSGPDFHQLRVVHAGRKDPVEPGTRLGAIYDAFEAGATLQVQHVDSRWEPLQPLTRALGQWAGAKVWANAYLTPGGNAQGFVPHHDGHDVLVAQIHGTKRWRLYGVRTPLPFEGRMFRESSPGAARYDRHLLLRAGDLLYLPRGTIHAAATEDVTSLHLTIAVEPVLWSTAIQDGIRKVFEQDVAFRRSMPPGFATRPQTEETMAELLRLLWERLSPRELVAQAQRTAAGLQTPGARGRLTAIAAADPDPGSDPGADSDPDSDSEE